MSGKIINFCPYCGKRLPKSSKIMTNFCCFCGKRLIINREKLTNKVQCTICHKVVDSNRQKTIKCSFCESMYHSSCVSSWLLKYNACPMCQNVFIFPNKIVAAIK